MSHVVLDASAVLALLNSEPGAEAVEAVVSSAALSTVNLTEVLSKLAEQGLDDEQLRLVATSLPCEIVPFDAGQAFAAAALRRTTRSKGLSLGDRACLAMAQAINGRALTTDTVWKEIDVGIAIEVIR